jgi:hypothetical protein
MCVYNNKRQEKKERDFKGLSGGHLEGKEQKKMKINVLRIYLAKVREIYTERAIEELLEAVT